MVAALRIPPVDRVPALRRPPVALLLLVPHRLATQCHAIAPQYALAAEQQHLAMGLVDDHAIRAQNSARHYLMPTTIESGPTRGSTRVSRNPAFSIHPRQSAPV